MKKKASVTKQSVPAKVKPKPVSSPMPVEARVGEVLGSGLLADVRSILREARGKAYSVANHLMVEAYWHIGRRIVEEEQGGASRANYGSQLIRNLSRQLGEEFGNGFSVANLKNFRQFYTLFPAGKKGYALRSELAWTHWRAIIRVADRQARDYYIRECAEQNWSSRQLERQIASAAHARLLSSSGQAAASDPTARMSEPRAFLKDPYVLEFLGIPESHPERVLEDALVARLQEFLMELGKGFSFVGRQMRVSTETADFYVDLVFYNYLLKCFVLLDLKTKKLTHGDVGQMDMYVRMFDDLKRGEGDNPTLGIILCADKDDTLVHYSVLRESRQLFASKYLTVLPSEEQLKEELERRHVLEWKGKP